MMTSPELRSKKVNGKIDRQKHRGEKNKNLAMNSSDRTLRKSHDNITLTSHEGSQRRDRPSDTLRRKKIKNLAMNSSDWKALNSF